ncbi:hypothetical protein HMPREF9131_0282, partial [Peptoniphilus sp. oral taxon 836 str. F0141]|uniref:DUF5317 family protein n=1 Tax=Peptoniphilus sp. oral taxon 836 TaxID=671216 RepID=UPI0001DCA5C2
MIFSALIFSIILIYLSKGSFKNILNFNYQKIELALCGILIIFLINFFTIYDFSSISDFFVKKYFYFTILALFFIIISLLFNYKVRGMIVIAFGLFCNTLPIIFNGKMPVSLSALSKINNDKVFRIISEGLSLSHGAFEHPKLYILSD